MDDYTRLFLVVMGCGNPFNSAMILEIDWKITRGYAFGGDGIRKSF